MTCTFSYIEHTYLPQRTKDELNNRAFSIVSRLKATPYFTQENQRLYFKKQFFAEAQKIVNELNREYPSKQVVQTLQTISKPMERGEKFQRKYVDINVIRNAFTEQEFKDFNKPQDIDEQGDSDTSVYNINQDVEIGNRIFQNTAKNDSQLRIQFSLTPEVNFDLKSAQILSSEKANRIFKTGDKNGWSIEKILSELQIPQEQKQLLLSFNTRNRQELLTNLLANYSYTIEINTAKEGSGEFKLSPHNFYDNFSQYQREGKYYMTYADQDGETGEYYQVEKEITKQQFEASEGSPTQYYSNLTVPGGTNYTENEIATPAIIPSIKGHAQFSTDNGIGWFRSDDKLDNSKIEINERPILGYDEYGNQFEGALKTYQDTVGGIITKTRRILEVQSDLFQKGRDKGILTGKIPDWEVREDNEGFYIFERGTNEKVATVRSREQGEDLIHKKGERFSKENQFLQLLNKDNNWVTFFVKAIIQSTAKETTQEVDKNDVENMVRQLEREGKLKIDCN